MSLNVLLGVKLCSIENILMEDITSSSVNNLSPRLISLIVIRPPKTVSPSMYQFQISTDSVSLVTQAVSTGRSVILCPCVCFVRSCVCFVRPCVLYIHINLTMEGTQQFGDWIPLPLIDNPWYAIG